jgi:hypothetical protein
MCTTCISEPAPRAVSRTVPSIGTLMLALLPKFGCPLCWPVLAATLGLFGLPIKSLNNIVIAITALMLTLALILLLRTKDRAPYILLGISSAFALAYRLALLPAVAAYILMALVAAFLVFRQIQHFVRYAPSDHS